MVIWMAWYLTLSKSQSISSIPASQCWLNDCFSDGLVNGLVAGFAADEDSMAGGVVDSVECFGGWDEGLVD
jgi:hypothetical protein